MEILDILPDMNLLYLICPFDRMVRPSGQELAELFRVHVSTVRRWIASGRVSAFRLPGGTYRIPADEVSRLRNQVVRQS